MPSYRYTNITISIHRHLGQTDGRGHGGKARRRPIAVGFQPLYGPPVGRALLPSYTILYTGLPLVAPCSFLSPLPLCILSPPASRWSACFFLYPLLLLLKDKYVQITINKTIWPAARRAAGGRPIGTIIISLASPLRGSAWTAPLRGQVI